MTTVGEGAPTVLTVEQAIVVLEERILELEGIIAAQASRIGGLEDECNRLRNGGPTSVGADLARRSGAKHFRK